MEVKLAVDGEEEMDETEQGHMRRETYTRSSRSAPWNKRRILVWVCGVLVVFCVGESFCSLFSFLLYLVEILVPNSVLFTPKFSYLNTSSVVV